MPSSESDERGGAKAPVSVRTPVRVRVEPGGPVLVEGPVEVDLGDGRTAVSDRFAVALCVCRRSRAYPWCDTSHRRRVRPSGPDGERGPTGTGPTEGTGGDGRQGGRQD